MDEKRDGRSENSLLVLDSTGVTVQGFRTVVPVIRAAAFWGAICLPWVALFLLFTGVATTYPIVFTLVVAAATVATVVGHNHTRR